MKFETYAFEEEPDPLVLSWVSFFDIVLRDTDQQELGVSIVTQEERNGILSG